MTYRYFGGFRLLLAVLVMLQHYLADLAPASLARAVAPYPIGNVAVTVFFALSGFVISEAIDRVYRGRFRAFLENRALRIIPHFLLALTLSILAHALFQAVGGIRLWRSQPSFPEFAFEPDNVMLNYLGIMPLIDRFISYNFLDITWALRVEIAFYLVMAGCIAVAGRIRRQSFPMIVGVAAVALSPMFVLAMSGKGIGMFSFLPYFAYGSGLYFALAGRNTGWIAVGCSLPAMVWQNVMQPTPNPAPDAVAASVAGSLILLQLLLAMMTLLACMKLKGWRSLDRRLGDMTYPLYLYHEIVLIIALTFSDRYSYAVLSAGILGSVALAAILTATVDPTISRYRDKVRGLKLEATI
jgi:peptidoglycan/LPS O-acetylase OafA/YrhL